MTCCQRFRFCWPGSKSYAARVNKPRVMAIDWSGRSGRDQRRFLWLAEAVDGELVRLEGGRTRGELVELLIAEADRDPNLIVGIDFAFSLPAWYLQERQLTPRQLWALLADEALTPTMQQLGLTRWMNRPELPFWITGEAHRQLAPAQMFRRTEQEVRVPGVQPKSVFQLVGAGQVGRGSLYGMVALHRLAGTGFRIWPFDPSGLPLVVEIFPRILTGPVRKNSPSERERYLGTVPMRPDLGRLAAASEDAFDAAISAVVMAAGVDELRTLPGAPGYALEGEIWQPHDPVALGTGDRPPRGAFGELSAAVAAVLREAVARGESATAQAEQVLDMLSRRGLLGGRIDRPLG
jgi:hypothetical protein